MAGDAIRAGIDIQNENTNGTMGISVSNPPEHTPTATGPPVALPRITLVHADGSDRLRRVTGNPIHAVGT